MADPIQIDPEIMGGRPCFAGTRVPVQTLLDYLAGGYTLDEMLDQFPTVRREDAVAVLQMAADDPRHSPEGAPEGGGRM